MRLQSHVTFIASQGGFGPSSFHEAPPHRIWALEIAVSFESQLRLVRLKQRAPPPNQPSRKRVAMRRSFSPQHFCLPERSHDQGGRVGGSLSDENGDMTLERDGRRVASAGTAIGRRQLLHLRLLRLCRQRTAFSGTQRCAHGRTTASFSTHFFVGAAPGPASEWTLSTSLDVPCYILSLPTAAPGSGLVVRCGTLYVVVGGRPGFSIPLGWPSCVVT